jgi:hypothetical protein
MVDQIQRRPIGMSQEEYERRERERAMMTDRQLVGESGQMTIPRANQRRSLGEFGLDAAEGFRAGVFGTTPRFTRDRKQEELTRATIRDAQQIKRALERENPTEAVNILVDRANILDRMGEDASDTYGLRNMIQAGNIPRALDEVNTFLLESQRRGLFQGDEFRALSEQERAAYGVPAETPAKMNILTGEPETMGATLRDYIGSVPPDYRMLFDDQGNPRMELIPGSPTDRENQRIQALREQASLSSGTYTDRAYENMRDLKIIAENTDGGIVPVFGRLGNIVASTGAGPGADARALVDTIKASIAFDRLQAMRNASPTGGALGQVSEGELKLLESTLGSLSFMQSREQFLDQLEGIMSEYERILTILSAYPNAGEYGIVAPTQRMPRPGETMANNLPDSANIRGSLQGLRSNLGGPELPPNQTLGQGVNFTGPLGRQQ